MKKKICLLLGSVFAVLALVAALYTVQKGRTIAASILTAEKQGILEQSLDFSQDIEFSLLFRQEEIPYDKTNHSYYLPQNVDGHWLSEENFTLSDESLSLYWYDDPYWNNLEAAIREGHAFTFLVSDGKAGEKGSIIFTGLPIMQLQTVSIINEEQNYYNVYVHDPFHHAGGVYEITKCNAYMSLRGKTSKSFPKKGWNLDLVKASGESYKTGLFGLREDDDWKLNALYPDAGKVREAVAMELWNELAAQTESVHDAGTRMEYFELFIDNEYMGLYGAMEQLDYKQFVLDASEDIIYKGYAWPLEGNIDEGTLNGAWDFCGHMIKTGDRAVSADLWQPFVEYADAANFAEKHEVCDTDAFYSYIQNHMDMDNFLNLELYVQMLYAFDNKYKNLYLATDIRDNGDYTIWRIPWDLNYSFGDRYSAENPALTKYNPEWARELMPHFMLSETLLEAGNEEFTKTLNKKWDNLKNGVFSLENVERIAREKMERLISSGAFERDENRWPDGPHDTSLEDILSFHKERLQYLDEHYSSYLERK